MADDVIFLQPTDATIILTEPDPEVLIIAGNGGSGPAGPAGPAGAPGGAQFVYSPSVPSSTWVINHGLNSLVHVTLLNTANVQVEADVIESTLNTVTIVFNSPFMGTALLSP